MTKEKKEEIEETNVWLSAIISLIIIMTSIYLSFGIALPHSLSLAKTLLVFACVGAGQLIIVFCIKFMFALDKNGD